MTIKWIFDDTRLEARNESGQLMGCWMAEEAHGRTLAMLLNHYQEMSIALQLPGKEELESSI